MSFVITSGVAGIISLYIFSWQQAVIYALLVLIFITLGKMLIMLLIASILPKSFRMNNVKQAEMICLIFSYFILIVLSGWYNLFLIIPSIAVALIDFYFKRESDKILGIK